MKKPMLILLIVAFPALLHAQVYQSLLDVNEVTDTEMVEMKRNIMIESDKIMVSPYGDDRLHLKVNRTEKKEKAFDGMATWYYCDSELKNYRTGENTKFIVIVPDGPKPKEIKLYQVIDDVTFIKKEFILN